MSQSAAFANYSNISKSLQQSAGTQQQGTSTSDKINDAANFEQQFLIGMTVHQKAKIGDQVAKFFKGSKKLQKATGLSEEDIGKITKGDFSGISKNIADTTSRKLQQGVKQIRTLKNQKLSDLADLKAKQTSARDTKNISDLAKGEKEKADGDVRDAQQISDKADAKAAELAGKTVGDNTAQLDAAATNARAAATAGVNNDFTDLENTASQLRQQADDDKDLYNVARDAAAKIPKDSMVFDATDDDPRLRPESAKADAKAFDAKETSDASEGRATDAQSRLSEAKQSAQDAQAELEDNAQRAEGIANDARASLPGAQQALATQQDQAASAANDARADLATKTQTASELAEESGTAEEEASAARTAVSEGVSAAQKTAADLEKVTSTVKKVASVTDKVEEGIAATSEFDPLALVFAGIGAIASAVIGRRVKTHDAVTTSVPRIQSSYAATIGA